MKRAFCLIVFLMSLASAATAQSLDKIKWMTEEYAPYNYTENGLHKGIAVDLLLEIWKKTGISKTEKDIEFVPWARGYKLTQEQKDTCLFSMTVTEDRKKLFKFAGPICPSNNSIIANKSKGLKISSQEDLKKITIGTVREDVGEQLLISAGIDINSLVRTNSADSLVRMLDKGRMDAVSYGMDTVKYNMKLAGIDPANYEEAFILKKGELAFAFHNDTDPAILSQFQKALDELKKDGTIDKIMAKYLH